MEIIGGVGIEVVADYSGLQSDFDAAQALAQQAGAKIADGIATGFVAPDTQAIAGSLQEVTQQATSAGQAIQQALDVQLPSLDASPVIESFQAISDAAGSTATAVSNAFANTAIPAMDPSGAVAGFQAVDDAAQQAATDIKEQFSGAAIPATDNSQIIAGFTAIDEAAKQASDAIAQDFAVQIPAPDVSGITGSFEQINEKAADTGKAVDDLGAEIQAMLEGGQATTLAEALAAALQKLDENASAGAGDLQAVSDGITTVGASAQTAGEQLSLFDKAAEVPVGDATGQLNLFSDAIVVVSDDCKSAAGNVTALGDSIGQIPNEVTPAIAAVKAFSDGAQAIVDAQSKATAELDRAKAVLVEIQAAYDQGTAGANELARAEQAVASAFAAANPAIEDSKHKVDAGTESLHAMNEALGLVGIALSVHAFIGFAEDVGAAYDSITKAHIALTTLTGSATEADEVIEKLDQIGRSDGLAMPGLAQAAQNMTNLLPEGTDVVGIISQLADVSAFTGKSIDALSAAFDRIVTSASVSAKQLQSLGTNFDQLKDTMRELGIAVGDFSDSAKKAFLSLDEHDKMVVLQTNMEKLKGLAEDVANNTFSGAMHKASAQFDSDLNLIIKDIGSLNGKLPDLSAPVNTLVAAFVYAGTYIKAIVEDITQQIVAVGVEIQGLGKGVSDAMKGQFTQAGKDISDAFSVAVSLGKQAVNDWNSTIATGTKVVHDLMNQTKASVEAVIPALDHAGAAGKDTGDKIGAAFAAAEAAVAKFDALANSDTDGVGALQRAFENAEKSINTVAKEDLPAAITAVDDYTAAQGRNKAGMEVFIQSFQEQSKLIQQLAKGDLKDATDAWVKYIGILDSAKAPLGVIQAALQQAEKDLQQLGKEDIDAANRGWDALIQKLRDTNAPLVVLNQALQDHMKFLSDTAAAADKAQAAFDKVAASYINLATHSPAVQQAFKDAYDTLNKLGLLLPTMPAPMDALNKAMSDFGLVIQKAKTPVEDLKTPIEQLTGDLDKLAEKAKSTGDWSAFNQALDDLDKRVSNLAKTDLPEAAKQLEAVIQEMIKAGAPTDLVQGQLAKLQPLLQKMAEENLPGAAAAWAKYIDLLKQVPSVIQDIQKAQEQQLQKDQQILDTMKARGDAYGYILDQQAKVYQEQIAYDEKTGKSAEAAIMGLEAVRLKQEEIRIETHGLADTYVEMTNEINNAFAAVSKGLADAIINGKSAADALANVFKALAQQILTTMIEGALKPLKASLLDLESNLFDKFKPGMDASTQGIKDFSDASAKAADAQKNLGATATQAAQAVSNLASTISIITGIIAAGAAVAADILLAHISSDTGHIEVNTRSCLAELENIRADLWSQFGQMYSRLGEVMNAVNRVYDQLGKLTIAAGGLSPADSANLADADKQLANMPAIVSMLAAIQANTQYTNANAAQTAANVVDQTNTLYDELAVINNSVLAVVTALTYGTHAQSEEMSDQSEQISSAVEDAAQATSQAIGDSAQMTAQAISSADNHRTADDGQIIARQNAILAQAQSQYQAALDANSQMQALRAEYGAYQNLQAQAIKDGDFALAQQYATYAQQTSAQLTSLMGGTEHIASSADSIYNSLGTHLTDVGGYIVSSGQSVVSAVQSSASQISNTVAAGVAATVAAYAVQMGNLISVAGAWGAAGGGTRTGLNGTTGGVSPNLPSGSGGGTVGNGPGLPSQSPDAVNSAKGGNSVGATPVDPVTGKPLTFAPPNIDWTPKVTPKAPVSDQGEVYTSTPGSTSTSSQSVGTPGTGASIDLQINAAAKAAAQAVAPNTARDKNAQGPETNAANFDPVAAAALTGQSVWEALQGHYDAVGAVNRQEAEARAGAAAQAQNTYTSTAGSTSISGTSGPAAPPGYTPSTLPQAMQDAAKATSSAAAAIASASQAADKIATVNAEMVAANKALADATASGDKSKIALAQQQVQSVQQLLSATLASQQQAAAAADKATLNADQQKALSAQLVAAQRALADATASGDKQKMAEAQMQVDSIKQLISAVMNNQTATAPPPTPISNSASVSPAGTNGQSAAFDPAPLYNWLSTIAGWEKTEVDAINGARDMISDRSVWGNNIIANTIADLAPHIDFVADSVVAAINHLGKAWNLPSFDVGGRIHGDQIAKVHDMEWVIPATGPISLPPDIMARIQMPTVPTLPSVPSVPTSIQGGGGDVYINSVNVQANNVDELLREISSRVKTRTGRTAKLSN